MILHLQHVYSSRTVLGLTDIGRLAPEPSQWKDAQSLLTDLIKPVLELAETENPVSDLNIPCRIVTNNECSVIFKHLVSGSRLAYPPWDGNGEENGSS